MKSDWRKFRDLAPLLRERYLKRHNARIASMLSDPKQSETERFWGAHQEMQKQAKALRQCLDGHSRSTMFGFIVTMIHNGMMTREDLEGFSDDLKSKLAPVLEAMKD